MAEIGHEKDNGDRIGPSTGTINLSLPRSNTVPETLHAEISDNPGRGQWGLFRSRTDRRKQGAHSGEHGPQTADDPKIVEKKLMMLNRIATVKDDGTIEFEVPSNAEQRELMFGSEDVASEAEEELLVDSDIPYTPPLQIVMLIVGTRGDVQPFVAIGKCLQDHGHRVRLATHANFKEFVLSSGLEFYPLGGDPKILAEYMVKNKGFLPSAPSEIPIQRKQMKDIIFSLLPACRDADQDSNIPFKAEAIIANPPAYGHTHVAEALKVPLHIFFTMPWTPTTEFPHPLSRVKQPSGYRLSYQIVDSMIWLGIRDMINEFRKKKLKLRPVTYLSGSQGSSSDVPHGYIWSPNLVPKPKDWGSKVDVVGFCFLDLASNYEPPQSLVKWLEAGEKPIYIGFGSLPVQEPAKMTKIIVDALEQTGQRGMVTGPPPGKRREGEMGISSGEREGISGLVSGHLKNERIIDGLAFPKTYLPSDPTSHCTADDLVDIVTTHQEELHDALHLYGALLFRGFHVHSVDDFSRVVEAFGWEEQPYEGAANRVKRGHRVYTTNEAPLHLFIPFHHEMALIKESCTKVFFHCLVPASEGGETSIVRSDFVVQKMEEAVPEAMKKLSSIGIKPVHKTKSADMSADDKELDPNRKLWHRLLKTDNEDEARKRAMEKLSCTAVEFKEDGTADFIYGPLNPIREYNGRRVMFNTILGFESSERDALIFYGDGTPLPAEVSETYHRLLEDNSVDVGWEKGDVLLVDNLRVQHARRPGKPPRSVMVSVCK